MLLSVDHRLERDREASTSLCCFPMGRTRAESNRGGDRSASFARRFLLFIFLSFPHTYSLAKIKISVLHQETHYIVDCHCRILVRTQVESSEYETCSGQTH